MSVTSQRVEHELNPRQVRALGAVVRQISSAVASVVQVGTDRWIRVRALDASLKFHEQNGYKHLDTTLTTAMVYERYIRTGMVDDNE